ncbi:hypothetical protein [Faecalimonas sp.]
MINIILIVLVIVSIILFMVAIVSGIKDTKKKKYYIKCVGRIDRIYKRKVIGSRQENRYVISPVILYTVRGNQYELIGTYYSKNMKVGQEATILYEENNPNKAIMEKGLYRTSFVTGIVGIAFIIAFSIIAVLKYVGGIRF